MSNDEAKFREAVARLGMMMLGCSAAYGPAIASAAAAWLFITTLSAIRVSCGLDAFKEAVAAFARDLSRECGLGVTVTFVEKEEEVSI